MLSSRPEVRNTDYHTHFAAAAAAVGSARDNAARAIASAAQANAKAICPVDTGRLRASIGAASSGGTAVIGTNTAYAPYVELGTARQRAQPYLVPALAEHIEEYAALLRAAMRNTEGGTE